MKLMDFQEYTLSKNLLEYKPLNMPGSNVHSLLWSYTHIVAHSFKGLKKLQSQHIVVCWLHMH